MKTLGFTFLMVSMFLASDMKGQNGQDKLPSVIPPSPTASSLGKYGELPISPYTGTVDVSIPLYSLPGMDMSVPISLSYHTSGVKVEETASWVGLGWSLNAGGAITRSVRGKPDESGNGLFYIDKYMGGLPFIDQYSNGGPREVVVNSEDPEYNNLRLMATNDLDTEPDVFYFNFNGHSGKLFFDKNGDCYSIPYQNLKIEKHIDLGLENRHEWIIVDGNGVKYFFGNRNGNGVEYTSSNGEEMITAWYLTKIVSTNKNEISFEYEDKSIIYHTPSTQSFSWFFPTVTSLTSVEDMGPNEQWSGDYFNHNYAHGKATLRKINTALGNVEFISAHDRKDLFGGARLDQIVVKNRDDKLIKRFGFDYKYKELHEERLYLSSIQEYGSDNESKNPYQFQYHENVSIGELPSRTTMAQDYWGYYNNAKSNTHLIPMIRQERIAFPGSFRFADRNVNEDAMKIGALEKIQYPTGGFTKIDYEAHFATSLISFNSEPELMQISSVRGTEAMGEFHIAYTQQVSLEIIFDHYREENNFRRPRVKLEKYNGAEWEAAVTHWVPGSPALQDEILYENIELREGQYRMVMDTENCIGPEPCNAPTELSEDYFATHVNLQYFKDKPTTKVGGLRVASIADYEYEGSRASNYRKFTYDPGKLVSVPIFAYSFQRGFCSDYNPWGWGRCEATEDLTAYVASSQSQLNLGASQGSHIVYGRVTESFGDMNENGRKEYVYSLRGFATNLERIHPAPPFAPYDYDDYLNGKLLSQTDFGHDGFKKKESVYRSVDAGVATNYYYNEGIKILKSYQPSSMMKTIDDKYYYDVYNLNTKWVYNESVTERVYSSDDDSKYLETNTFYKYNPINLQPTKTTQINSEGKALLTETYYATDYLNVSSGVIADMKWDVHMHNQVIETINKEGDAAYNATTKEYDVTNLKVIGGIYTTYEKRPNEIILPVNVSALEINDLLLENDLDLSITKSDGLPDGRYYQVKQSLAYNDYGKIVEMKDNSEINKAFIWGYDNTLPIIKASNTDQYILENAVESAVSLATNGVHNDINLFMQEVGDLSTTTQENLWSIFNHSIRNDASLSAALVLSYSYDLQNGIKSVTDPNGKISYFTYDGLGRLVSESDFDANLLRAVKYQHKVK